MPSKREADENFTIETRLRLIKEAAQRQKVSEKPSRGEASPEDIKRIIDHLQKDKG